MTIPTYEPIPLPPDWKPGLANLLGGVITYFFLDPKCQAFYFGGGWVQGVKDYPEVTKDPVVDALLVTISKPLAIAHAFYRDIRRASPKRDPVVLDLDGDGIKTTSVNSDVAVIFDHNGDGFAELTGWADLHDGVLGMDRNGNGIIDDGKELFGDQTILKSGQRATSGFEALAELDSNRDGKIDANDEAYSQLRVLTLNATGYGYQLRTLEELGIKSINLDSTITNVTDAQGNTQNRVSSFEMTDGTIREIAEYSFQRNPFYSIATEWLPVPNDIAAFPDLPGYGTVYNLHQAMVRDNSGELKSLVEQFASATDSDARSKLMEKILFKWTGTQSDL